MNKTIRETTHSLMKQCAFVDEYNRVTMLNDIIINETPACLFNRLMFTGLDDTPRAFRKMYRMLDEISERVSKQTNDYKFGILQYYVRNGYVKYPFSDDIYSHLLVCSYDDFFN